MVAAKRRAIAEADGEALTEYAAEVRSRAGRAVPDFDPVFGGQHARALVLLEAPGPKAAVERGGSGLVSPDNDDPTAEAMWQMVSRSRIERQRIAFWNVVPWYLGSGTRISAARAADIEEGSRLLPELTRRLPDLRVVLTLGDAARAGWLRSLNLAGARLIPTLATTHPASRALNARPDARADLQHAFQRLAEAVEGT